MTLSRARPPDYGPIIRWTQDPQNPAVAGASDDSCGSLPGKIELFEIFDLLKNELIGQRLGKVSSHAGNSRKKKHPNEQFLC